MPATDPPGHPTVWIPAGTHLIRLLTGVYISIGRGSHRAIFHPVTAPACSSNLFKITDLPRQDGTPLRLVLPVDCGTVVWKVPYFWATIVTMTHRSAPGTLWIHPFAGATFFVSGFVHMKSIQPPPFFATSTASLMNSLPFASFRS